MKLQFKHKTETLPAELNRSGDDISLRILEKQFKSKILEWSPPFFEIQVEGEISRGAFYRLENAIDVHLPQGTFRLHYEESRPGTAKASHAPGELTAPMPGKILKVLVGAGKRVKKGDPLLILEAMKMEHSIVSPWDGKVTQVLFQEGDRVSQDQELVVVESA